MVSCRRRSIGRFYDPTTGTWTQQDTYNAPLDAHNANRYLYAGGDPVNYIDLTGQIGLADIAGGITGVFAGAVCEAASLGIGTLGCGFVAFGVSLAVANELTGDDHA